MSAKLIFLYEVDHEAELVHGIVSANYVDLSYRVRTKQPIIVLLSTNAVFVNCINLMSIFKKIFRTGGEF